MVDVWLFPTTVAEQDCADFASVLSPEERERAARFKFERDRVSSIISRATVRQFLAQAAGCNPAEIQFTAVGQGKPCVAGPPRAAGLFFNVSHSGTLAAIAITSATPVGIDIEHMRENVEVASIAEEHFCPSEMDWLVKLPDRDRLSGFYRLWTLKEAALKAHGAGLSIPLNQVCVWPARRTVLPANDGCPESVWSTSILDAPAGYAAALAVKGEVFPSVRFHSLDLDIPSAG
jgi:4'-phosphopantetheinyl transferase